MITRIVRMTFKKELVSSFISIFKENQDKIRDFSGCRYVHLYQDVANPYVFITYSEWESIEDLELYRQSDLFKTVWAKTKTCFDDKPIAFSMKKYS